MKKLVLSRLTLASLMAVTPAAAELVTNGGFESAIGLFDGWTATNNHLHDGAAHSGLHAASFGATSGNDVLSQSLSTVSGQLYTVSFWLANEGGPSNAMLVQFGGVTLLSLGDQSPFGYQQYSFNVLASSGTTVLSFTGYQVPSHYNLDDVSVTSTVPEPASWAMMITALGLAVTALRGRSIAVKFD